MFLRSAEHWTELCMRLLRGQRTVQRTVQLNETLPLTLPEALAAHARANAAQQLL